MASKLVMNDYDNVPPEGQALKATLVSVDDNIKFSSGDEGVLFRFKLADHVGWSATALCSGDMDRSNRFGRIVAGLLGRMPGSAEVVADALEACVGNRYNVTLKHNEKDDGVVFLNVETIEGA